MNYREQIFEILNVEPLEDFRVKNTRTGNIYNKIYYIDNQLYVCSVDDEKLLWELEDDVEVNLSELLCGDYEIVKMKQEQTLSKGEYDKAKALIELGLNWAARDSDSELFFYESRPSRPLKSDFDTWRSYDKYIKGSDLNNISKMFKFVRWQDAEPTDLKQLIKEFEYYGNFKE